MTSRFSTPFIFLFSTLFFFPFLSQAESKHPYPKYLHINLTKQRVELIENEKTIFRSKASTGREKKKTPTGTFKVTNKHEKWTSTIYKVKMPYFLRFNHGAIGLHAGPVSWYPGSAGCIRLPEENAKKLFPLVPIGTPVVIEGEAPTFEEAKRRYKMKTRFKKGPFNNRSRGPRI